MAKHNIEVRMKLENILLLILAMVLIEVYACKDKGIEPTPTKSPRDYTWIADTISYRGSYIQTEMLSIWGSSPNDVYGVGFNNAFENVLMWHYDGKNWSDVKLDLFGLHPGELFGVYGFVSNNVYAVGVQGFSNNTDSSLIIHYDGSSWSEVNIIKSSRWLNDIYGSSPNDIWACGWGGVIYHYDGIKWNKDSIYNPQRDEFQLESIAESKNTVYVIGEKHDNILAKDTYYFFKKAIQSWQTLDSFVVAPGQTTFKFGTRLWANSEGNLYSSSDGVFKWNGSSWNNIYVSSIALPRIFGTSEQNIFVVGNYGIVLHFNGVDWYQFQQLKNENVAYSGVWTDGKEAFICGFTTDSYPMKTIVWHGK